MSEKNRRFIFYSLVVLVIVVSSISVLWLPEDSAEKGPADTPPLIAFLPLFAYLVLILLPVIYKRREGGSFVWGHRFLKGTLLGFILITMIFLIELAAGLIHIADITPDIQSTLIAGIGLQLVVAFGEEIPFRGYILPDMQKRYSPWRAVFFSSLFFSILHIPSILTLNSSATNTIIMLVTITIAEILLAICYLYDGLLMSIGFHFAWNFFQYHVFSLREDFGGILKITSGSQLLTGGTLGPEAGLLGMVVVTLALIIVFLWLQTRQ